MFCIYGYPRAGVRLLAGTLGTHQDVKCPIPAGGSCSIVQLPSVNALTQMLEDEGQKHNCILLPAIAPPGSIAQQEEYAAVCEFIRVSRIPVIEVRRKDILRRELSLRIAAHTGKWSIPIIATQCRTKAVMLLSELDLQRLVYALEVDREEDKLSACKPYVVTYEDMLLNFDVVMMAVQQYIGIQPDVLLPVTGRMDVRKIRTVLLNYNDLKKQLGQTYPQVFKVAEQNDELFCPRG